MHSLNIGLQLKVYELEKRMGVPQRQQFPFFEEMHWYVAQHYVARWRKEDARRLAGEAAGIEAALSPISKYELAGLADLATSLCDSPPRPVLRAPVASSDLADGVAGGAGWSSKGSGSPTFRTACGWSPMARPGCCATCRRWWPRTPPTPT